jgi:type IV secretion system protein VirB11
MHPRELNGPLVTASGTQLGYAEIIRYLEGSIDVIVQMGRDGEKRGVVEIWVPGAALQRV